VLGPLRLRVRTAMAAAGAGAAAAGAGAAAPAGQGVRVVCRFRPLNKMELTKGTKCSVTALTEDAVNLSTADGNAYSFAFDRIYGTASAQADVYEYAAKPILQALFQGFNGCLLA